MFLSLRILKPFAIHSASFAKHRNHFDMPSLARVLNLRTQFACLIYVSKRTYRHLENLLLEAGKAICSCRKQIPVQTNSRWCAPRTGLLEPQAIVAGF
jgi:hypothetical protein